MNAILNQPTTATDCPMAVFIRDNNILRGLRAYDQDTIMWTFPGGRADTGETIEFALQREVKEETAIDDFVIRDYIGDSVRELNGDRAYFFLCETDQHPVLTEPEKFITWTWMAIQDYINDPEQGKFNPQAHHTISKYLRAKYNLLDS